MAHYGEGDFKATFSGALLEINLIFEFKNKNLALKASLNPSPDRRGT
jgi:hypothetical protein